MWNRQIDLDGDTLGVELEWFQTPGVSDHELPILSLACLNSLTAADWEQIRPRNEKQHVYVQSGWQMQMSSENVHWKKTQ